jgi:hypothetical protein
MTATAPDGFGRVRYAPRRPHGEVTVTQPKSTPNGMGAFTPIVGQASYLHDCKLLAIDVRWVWRALAMAPGGHRAHFAWLR